MTYLFYMIISCDSIYIFLLKDVFMYVCPHGYNYIFSYFFAISYCITIVIL